MLVFETSKHVLSKIQSEHQLEHDLKALVHQCEVIINEFGTDQVEVPITKPIDTESIYQDDDVRTIWCEQLVQEGLGMTELRSARCYLDALTTKYSITLK